MRGWKNIAWYTACRDRFTFHRCHLPASIILVNAVVGRRRCLLPVAIEACHGSKDRERIDDDR